MVSFELARVSAAARALAVAAVIVPSAALSQHPGAVVERQLALIDRIEEIQASDGAASAKLVAPLAGLALLQQEQGEHALAVATLTQARQIVRMNSGLHSLDEAPLLGQLIRSEQARGNIEAAWRIEQDLLALAQRNLGDARTAPIFAEIARKRSVTLDRYRSGELPPEVVLGCYYERSGTPNYDRAGACGSGQRSTVIAALLTETLQHHAQAIEAMIEHERYASRELRDLEMAAVRIAYSNGWRFADDLVRCATAELAELVETDLLHGCLAPAIRVNGDLALFNVGGAASLVRVLAYAVRSEAPALDRASALVQVADWQLIFARPKFDEPLLPMYELARKQLEDGGVGSESIDDLFAPALPVILPSFLPNPLVSDASAAVGHIDVAFDITEHGLSENVEILDTTTGASLAAKRRLYRAIQYGRFRPRTVEGRFVERAPVAVRYYVK